jgi:hypothetical protein
MNLPDIELLATRMIGAVRRYVAEATYPIGKQIDELFAKINAIPAGPKGDSGAAGERGQPGEKGDPGPLGVRGEKGDRGDAGPQGDRGEAGTIGETGPPGERGERGENALPGDRGAPGADGKDGAPGARGADGQAGAPGRDGTNGKSAYQLAQDQGFAGTELLWLESLRGAPGGHGADGREGKDGRDGRDGKDGDAGRDALAIDILPAIDDKKSYPRGTFAQHRGGLVRSIRNTDPITDGFEKAGWAVIIEGVAAVVISQGDDLRTLSVITLLTSGIKAVCDFTLPVLIYREVWTEREYVPGDVVTWGGSAWHCQIKTTAKPGSSTDWRLMVKEGARGKDGGSSSSPPSKIVSLK